MDQINTAVVQSPMKSQMPSVTLPTSSEIKKTFVKGGDSPLDFINNNLKHYGLQPVAQPLDPQGTLAKVEANRSQSETQPNSADKIATIIEPELTFDSNKLPEKEVLEENKNADEIATNLPEEKVTEDLTFAEPQVNDKELNFKKVRETLKEKTNLLKQKDEELKTVSEKLKKYETGEVLPEVLSEKESEIERLRTYEKIVNLKGSVEYQEKYIKPISKIQEKINQIAADYDIPVDVINDAVETTNQADLNRFLSDHFDNVGALEVKQLFTEMKNIQKEAQTAEKEPETAIQKLQQESAEIRQRVMQEKRVKLAGTVKNSWRNQLGRIHQEGKAKELISIEGDEEHNTNIVKPLLTAASQEYGKLVTMLADNGLEELPDSVADALARMVLLAHASATSITSREAAQRHAEEVTANAQRSTSYSRPLTSGGFGGNSAPVAPVETPSPRELGRQLAHSVIQNRR